MIILIKIIFFHLFIISPLFITMFFDFIIDLKIERIWDQK